MYTKNIKLWTILNCTPKEAYKAWMDSKKHGAMVDGNAEIDPSVGGIFSVWDEAIKGKTLELHPEKNRIVQSWHYEYDDWPKDLPSKLTIEFVHYKKSACKVRLWQTGIPASHAEEIKQGWNDYYWNPMKKYFEGKNK